MKELDKIAEGMKHLFEPASSSNDMEKIDTSEMNAKELTEYIAYVGRELDNTVYRMDLKTRSVEHLLEELKTCPFEAEGVVSRLKAIKTGADALSDGKSVIEYYRKSLNSLSRIYPDKTVQEAGFDSFDELYKHYSKLDRRISKLSLKYGNIGQWIYRKEIDALKKREKHLEEIYYDKRHWQAEWKDSWHKKSYYETDKIFTNAVQTIVDRIIAEYRNVSEQVVDTKKINISISKIAEVSKSLDSDHIDRYVMPRFEEKYEEALDWKKHGTDFLKNQSAEDIRALTDKKAVRKALAILKKGMNSPHQMYMDERYTEEQKKAIREFNDAYEVLPHVLNSVIQPTMMDRESSTARFRKIGNFIYKMENDRYFHDAGESLKKTRNALKKILGQRMGYETDSKLTEIAKEYTDKMSKIVSELDTKRMLVAMDNEQARSIYGEKLDEFYNHASNMLSSALLDHPTMGIGYKLADFRVIEHMPYTILNFWREPGSSGEMTFLLNTSNPKDTIAAKYIYSITDEELGKLKELSIPGLMKVIETVRKNSDTFRDSQTYIRTGENTGYWEDNPANAIVMDGLGEMCSYYIKNGNSAEHDFALVTYLRRVDHESEHGKDIIRTTSEKLGLTDKQEKMMTGYYSTILDFLDTRTSGDVDKVKTALSDSAKLCIALEKTDEFVKKSALQETLMAERGAIIKDYAEHRDSGIEYVTEYLKALDDEKIAERYKTFDSQRQSCVRSFARTAYGAKPELVIPLVQKAVEKEKSVKKIEILKEGIGLMINTRELGTYIAELFKSQPNTAYDLFTTLSVSKPVLDDEFYGNIRIIFSDHNFDSYTSKYEHLIRCQEKKEDDKTLKTVGKYTRQIGDYKEQLEKGENETVSKKLAAVEEKLTAIISREKKNAVNKALSNSCKRALQDITGSDVSVDVISEDMINAISIYRAIDTNKNLLAGIICDTLDGNQTQIYSVEANQKAREKYTQIGIDMDMWMSGITKTYEPEKTKDVEETKKANIAKHRKEALDIYKSLGYDVPENDIFSKYDEIKKRDDVDHDIKMDLKTQLNAIKSMEGAVYNSKIGDVTVYTEQDMLKILQMGNYFSNSCLALGKGNTCSTVANAVDINKRVLYATMNGEVIGRKLIALNDDGEIVQFRTYNNNLDINLDHVYEKHLYELSEK
ncbi:MAG: hypothetical protein V1870_01485, partial [Candidatus Aenigmatarchaeota archaeon]